MNIGDMGRDDMDKIVEEMRRYICSPKGRRELTEALKRADEDCERMREASRVRGDEPFLYEPLVARAEGRAAGRIEYGRKKRKAA